MSKNHMLAVTYGFALAGKLADFANTDPASIPAEGLTEHILLPRAYPLGDITAFLASDAAKTMEADLADAGVTLTHHVAAPPTRLDMCQLTDPYGNGAVSLLTNEVQLFITLTLSSQN